MKKTIFLILIIYLTACSTDLPNSKLLLVSTTSTQDSGLLDVLLPVFEEETGYSVQLISTGSGQALKIAEQGNADVILLHSPSAEEEFMAKGLGIDRRLVMHNDFVIVGPTEDAANIRGKSPVEALDAIYQTQANFVSRGDESGTNIKELSLWKQAGLDPEDQPWYLQTGQGQGATLSVADVKNGYALTDRGTFLAYRANVSLAILVENNPALLNIYHVITVNPEKWPGINLKGAHAFTDFITSPEGQQIIREFGVDQYGEPLFFADAGQE